MGASVSSMDLRHRVLTETTADNITAQPKNERFAIRRNL